MPIYEFYCSQCNTIYSFLSRTIQPEKRPPCPHCKKPRLARQVSPFAATGQAREDSGGEGDDLPFDESKMAGAMDTMAREAEDINEEDPRQAAGLMRKFSQMTGMELGPGMQEALNRIESGEDPEQIEAEMGDRLEQEDPFRPPDGEGQRPSRRRRPPARRDATLYEM
jgi:putative FmdB family regulatory protein